MMQQYDFHTIGILDGAGSFLDNLPHPGSDEETIPVTGGNMSVIPLRFRKIFISSHPLDFEFHETIFTYFQDKLAKTPMFA